jgi:hypothetical protein
VTKKGLVYGDSRDDWCPYEDGVTIVKHLEDVGCDVVSLSPYVDDDDLRGDLLSQVDLYLFDPLFLTDPKYATLVLQLDAAIRKGEQTGVSVLLPKRIPSAVRDELEVICHAKLPLTADGYGKGRGQWLASSVMDLRSYVSRFLKELQGRPSPERLRAMSDLLSSFFGAQSLSLPKPTLGTAH